MSSSMTARSWEGATVTRQELLLSRRTFAVSRHQVRSFDKQDASDDCRFVLLKVIKKFQG